ncbi:MAG TPA: serine hydrolase [Bryobacteraceae bacterium]|nr:serine hydrolase [Bryobacteraceae bacterium]
MLRRTVLLIAAGAALALASGQPLDRAKIDAAVQRSMKDWGVPGCAIAIVRGNDVLLTAGYGVKEAGKPDRVDPNTIFAIGSMTKAFTTAAMSILVDDGKMNWDDPVRKYIEFFHLEDPLADEMVTLRDLVCHRTGLARNDMLWYNSPLTSEEIIRRIAYLKPTRPFRSAWQYNNLMFLTAGYAVSKTAGTTWQSFVQTRIFDPLGMKTADFTTDVVQHSSDHASPHRKTNGKTEAIAWRNLDNIAPAGSINASVVELANWARLQLNKGEFEGKHLISARNMAEMHTPQMAMRPEDWGREWNPETHQISYGMGWELHDYRGLHLVSHGGAIDGFRGNITLLPDQKLGIVVLSNLDQENMPEALRFSLIDAVLGLAPRDWDSTLIEHFRMETDRAAEATKKRLAARHLDTKPSRELDAYAGEYFDPGYGTATVSLAEGALHIAWSNFKEPLEHFQFDTFDVKAGSLRASPVQFQLGPNGEVRTMNFLGVDFAKRSNHRQGAGDVKTQ